MPVMKTKTSKSKSLFIIINLSVMFVVVVLAKSDHDHHPDHHHHHSDHQHGHQLLNKAKKIYNGRRASPEEAKFMAAILRPKAARGIPSHRFLCSAVVITHDMVLTAAHCFSNYTTAEIQSLEVLPGSAALNSAYYTTHKDLIRTIQSFWIHPGYESLVHTYDLAIIKVGPAPWPLADDRRRVTVAQMPVRVKRRHQRSLFKAYGYGWEDWMIITGHLNAVEYTREYSQDLCEKLLAVKLNEPNILFATKERSHTHHLHILSGQTAGDSGGGVFVYGTVERLDTARKTWVQVDTEILVGIHSSHRVREETMRSRVYFFHTNITTFLPWIKRYSDARFDTYPFPYLLR